MIPNTSNAKLIVLEGLDGAGTTTQLRLLADSLRALNLRVWITREPSNGPVGAQIRSVLTRRLTIGKNALTALFSADRLDHLYSKGGIKERLNNGEWVIMDRYYLSSFAYQSLNMNEEEKKWLYSMHMYCIQPDLTIFIDVRSDTSLARIAVNRSFHFELFETYESLNAIRDQYMKAIIGLRKMGEVIHVIPGEPPINLVQKNIFKRVKTRFFNSAFLDSDAELRILAYSKLKIIRQRIEEEVGLTYLGVIDHPPSISPSNPSKNNAGGAYSLEFFDENALEYHIVAFLNRERTRITKIIAQTSAKGRDKLALLKRICDAVIDHHRK